MKIERAVAVLFLASLGLAKADEWSNAKIAERLRQVPDRIDAEKVKPDFTDAYAELKELTDQEEITVTGKEPEGAEENPTPKAKKPKASLEKSAKKPAKEKPAAKKKEPKPAKVPKVKKVVEVDGFGFRKTSVRSKVLSALKGSNQSLEDIVKGTGLDEKQVHGLLGWASRSGLAEVEKVTYFRLAPAKKGK